MLYKIYVKATAFNSSGIFNWVMSLDLCKKKLLLFFQNVFRMVEILCKFCICFGTYKIEILEFIFKLL